MFRIIKVQDILLHVFFLSLNFEVWDILGGSGAFSVAKLTGYLYVFSLIPSLGSFLNIHKSTIPIIIPLFWFYLFFCLVNLININSFSTDVFQFSILQNIILFVLIVNHERRSPGILEKAFIFFFIGSLILAACYFGGVGVEINQVGRVSLFGDNENIIGIRMVTSALVLSHILLKKGMRIANGLYFLLFAYVPLIALMLNTGSRVAFLGFMLSLVFIVMFYKKRGLLSKILVLFFGLFFGLFVFNTAMQTESLSVRLLHTINDGNIAGRGDIWASLLPLLKSNWFCGVGRTGYIEYYINKHGFLQSPHNVFIEVLAYSGVVGFGLFFGFLLRTIKTAYIFSRRNNEILPIVFFIPILGVLLSAQILTFKLGWVVFAYGASRVFYLQKEGK